MKLKVFSIVGPDYISLIGGEVRNPRRVLPRAFKSTIYRVFFFYVIGALCVGIVASSNDEALLGAIANGAPGAAKSPYVICKCSSQSPRAKLTPHSDEPPSDPRIAIHSQRGGIGVLVLDYQLFRVCGVEIAPRYGAAGTSAQDTGSNVQTWCPLRGYSAHAVRCMLGVPFGLRGLYQGPQLVDQPRYCRTASLVDLYRHVSLLKHRLSDLTDLQHIPAVPQRPERSKSRKWRLSTSQGMAAAVLRLVATHLLANCPVLFRILRVSPRRVHCRRLYFRIWIGIPVPRHPPCLQGLRGVCQTSVACLVRP